MTDLLAPRRATLVLRLVDLLRGPAVPELDPDVRSVSPDDGGERRYQVPLD